jgi:gliding motility-associated-like protein
LYDGTNKYLTPFVGDINNDFELDVYERVGGFGNTANMLYINNGNAAAFTEASAVYGLNFGTGFDHNQGAVWFDIDKDGDKDLVLIEENLIKVMRNNLTGKNWIKLKLNGCQSNKDAIGIKVVLKANNEKMVACKGLGTGQNQVQSDLHFGLDNSTVVDSITIYWSNSNTLYLSNQPANQILTINEDNNCPVNFLPLSVQIGNDTALCQGTTLMLKATSSNDSLDSHSLLYKWNDGSSLSYYLVKSSGTYSVEVRDNRGCIATDTIVVSVLDQHACDNKDQGTVYNPYPSTIFVPKAFSPNHDGVNDDLEIFGKNLNEFKIMIYNRWGEIIFISEDRNVKWNGTYRGEDMQIGTYPWVLYYNETNKSKNISELKVVKGSVTLIR